ncbi:MAG: hypothetical protein QCI82_04930 [Candidatus Thermoplasmatota archaeon]|nr:hypothetical protein [Candidatus Thermoplasmatota archaeon]
MKWNELIAVSAAVIIGVFFVIYPMFSVMTSAVGITPDTAPLFTAYGDGPSDISMFVKDVERLNYHVKGSIYYSGSDDNDGVYDYKVRAITSSPVVLLGDMIDPTKTLYMAIGVERAYTPDEVNAINNFLMRGGKAFIADDFGNANYLAKEYGVTFYGGQLYDENFDKNANYTILKGHMGSDLYDREGVRVWTRDNPWGDGVWDDDQDADGKIDEDDNMGSSKNYDDDRDNARLTKDLRNNDPWRNNVVDEENEGYDEDPIDDDWMFTPGGDAHKLWYGHPNVNTEWLDGKSQDDDNGDGIIDLNDIIDEDLMHYHIITYKPTGLSSAVNPWIWSMGSSKSWVDMNNDRVLSIPEGELRGENADEVSSIGNEILFCLELPVADDGSGAVDIITGESKETIKKTSGEPKKYKVAELNPNEKLITKLGSIVFMGDPSAFMNDLYALNHIRYDVNLPFDPIGNGRDDDGDGLIDEDREILQETGDISPEDQEDANNLADNSPDYWSEAEADMYDWITDDMVGKDKYDYHNSRWLLDMVRKLCPAEEGETNLVLIDESRHRDPGHFIKPVYRSMELTAYLTSNPFYAYPIVISIGFILMFVTLLIQDKENWMHVFDISVLSPRRVMPKDPKLQTTKLKLAIKEKVRLIKGLSPEEFATLNEVTIMSAIRDPDLIELIQSEERSYTQQEIARMIEKIRKIQSM